MKKYEINYIERQLLKIHPNYKLISASYINSKSPLKILCDKQHETTIKWNALQQGHGCHICSPTRQMSIQAINKWIVSNNIKLTILSDHYNNSKSKLKWICNNRHVFYKSWSQVRKTKKCPQCSVSSRLSVNKIAERMYWKYPGYKLISRKYLGNRHSLDFKCPKGHFFSKSWRLFNSKSKVCPKCFSTEAEQSCREIFEKIFKLPFIKSKPIWLVNDRTGGRMELDGYNEELKLAFEYDGIQHYIPKFKCTYADLLKIQQRDKLKNKLCKDFNIDLIRIPYWKKDILEEFIINELSLRGLYHDKEK